MGEIQGQSLGIDVDVYTDQGKSVNDGEKGELVVKPFPSMPIKFWGDDDGKNIIKLISIDLKIFGIMVISLFNQNNGFIMRGRSDATLNPEA